MPGSRFVRLLARAVCLLVCCCEGAGFPSKQITNPAGPITRITVGQDGALQVEHQDYPAIGQFYPKTVWPADCGIFLRHNGKVDGIDYTRHDGTMAYNTQAIAFQPVAQTQSTDGCLVRTVMDNTADSSGVLFKLTQDVSYFPGDSWFLVSALVENQSGSPQTVDFFAAADVYVANEDAGYPYLNPECPHVAIGGASYTGAFRLFAQPAPGSPQPTSYQEDAYASIWSYIGDGLHFNNTTNADYRDNGAGLEWQEVTIPAGGAFSVSYYWAVGAVTCVELPARAPRIQILWSGGTNMVLHWDQTGYVLEASSNSLCCWTPLSVPITTNETAVDMDLSKNVFYRLVRP